MKRSFLPLMDYDQRSQPLNYKKNYKKKQKKLNNNNDNDNDKQTKHYKPFHTYYTRDVILILNTLIYFDRTPCK